MKGVIVSCFEELVKEKFGQDKWDEILDKVGIDKGKRVFLATEDIDDAAVMNVLDKTCEVLDMSVNDVTDAFGDYWVNSYAPRFYKIYFNQAHSAREFLLNMDNVHIATTKSIANAHPPRFEYEWKDDNTLIMTYKSERGLIDLFISLVKGVGKHYHEDLKVTKLDNKKVEIVFPS
ncbi:heme NO-binding domain-containing protein [Patescibacteria group bacterium]|nr:heme NO-binding domain-containing protein [Patescibacteria group bacterium]